MRVNFSANTMACQPLRNFGKKEHSQKNNPSNNPAFASNTVSREDYDRLNAKYDLLSRFAAVQLQQYNELAARYKSLAK